MSTGIDMAARPRRSMRSHQAVLSAAVEVAARRGYGGTTVEEVAARAGVGKQTIYRWWPNKAALFIEVYGRLVPPDLVAEHTGTLRGDLEALLSALTRIYGATPAGTILSGLIAEAQADPALAEQLRETYVVPRRTILASILERAAARGEIAQPEALDFVSDLVSGAVWFRLLLGERRLDRAFRTQLVDVILHGILPRVSGAKAKQPAKKT